MEVVLGKADPVVSAELDGLEKLIDGDPVQFDSGSCMGVMLSDGVCMKAQVRCGANIEFCMPLQQFSALIKSLKPS
jgi:hypothetical protein